MTAASLSRKPAKPNGSILNFFQKTQRPEGSLFVGAATGFTGHVEDNCGRDDDQRDESTSPNKKRKVSGEQGIALRDEENSSSGQFECSKLGDPKYPKNNSRLRVPFLMDSDSDGDDGDDGDGNYDNRRDTSPSHTCNSIPQSLDIPSKQDLKPSTCKPHDEQHSVSGNTAGEEHVSPLYDKFSELEGDAEMDLLDLDGFEGEELREMRFMQEQARLEAEEAGTLNEDFGEDFFIDESATQSCPICNGNLTSLSMDDATRHVNSCLDGNPIPLPSPKPEKPKRPPVETQAAEISKRFARAAIPRPGQASPFQLENGTKACSAKSAFSELMSNKAEDSAWAAAAAAENASRGRPAYERTCPFYKIIPGFNICVDAFRYGAVKGCKAYFLSHFHSDHYIGLTANWTHGPIYCSKVTGSLVKQQLRTAAKWVVEMEFEKSYDIPGTDGATVVMIAANHCPGSSLFLFQKPAETGPKRRGKRILHCGDFRACPSHVNHPLMRPDVKDELTGKLSQQVIDICYLDTTYLNPRYSFPPQDDVVKACADLCASLSPDPNCKDDVWEKGAKEEGTRAVSKYFQREKQSGESKDLPKSKLTSRLLIICGTYSIGKERICVAIAKALKTKIYANPGKMRICKQLDDPELSDLLTSDPIEAQVHMQSLMEIRAETLQEYLNGYKPHFSRIVGFRPTGWTYRPPNGKQITANTSPSTISTQQLLHGRSWRTRFAYKDFVAQRGSTKEAMCFGVPYSEHSSFRELAMFIMSLRIDKVIPTVNVGSEQSRKRMKGWLDRWSSERRRGGLTHPLVEGQDDEDNKRTLLLWDDRSGKGGGVWW